MAGPWVSVLAGTPIFYLICRWISSRTLLVPGPPRRPSSGGRPGFEALSRKAGLSPFYLQRLFEAAIGETPKAYTSRLRLERGAFRLLVHDSNVLDIALECGFQSHETFSAPSPALRPAAGRLPGVGAPRAAVTTHAVPYDTLPTAYAAIFPRVLALLRWGSALGRLRLNEFDAALRALRRSCDARKLALGDRNGRVSEIFLD